MSSNNPTWVPEIMYEEASDNDASQLPFIMGPTNEVMPKLLYIFESRETGEFEPGLEGEEVPVVEWDLHQYADMAVLKSRLRTDLYDEVREALGLEPMSVAVKKGQEITERVRDKLS